jgi:hypothetical protein
LFLQSLDEPNYAIETDRRKVSLFNSLRAVRSGGRFIAIVSSGRTKGESLMTMKVWVQLHNGEERTYEQVARVDDSDRYKVTVIGDNGVLAIIDKSDLKNLLTEEQSE